MIVPPEALKFIALQSGYVDQSALPGSYIDACFNRAKPITPLLMSQPLASKPAFVDIGGGMAGTSLILAKQFGATLHIVDGDSPDGIPDRLCEDQPFNSFAAAREFIEANGFPGDDLFFHRLSVAYLPQVINLVVSFASWGFHFPLDRYISIIGRLPYYRGLLVVDLRRGKNEDHKLAPYFDTVDIVNVSAKCDRFYLRRNGKPYDSYR